MSRESFRSAGLAIFYTVYLFNAERRCWGDEAVKSIIFGSCIRQDQPAPLLELMADKKTDVVIFLGDNIYGDSTDMSVLKAKYEQLRELPGFEGLVGEAITLATWDDHDYGVNDGGADYAQREASEKLFLDFWKFPMTAPERNHPGVYGAHLLGPVGQRLQVILLDTRYFRSTLKTGERRDGGRYVPDDSPNKTMLGEAQWMWLAEELRKPAEVRILASSIQCLPTSDGQECWANFPRERNRLFKLIDEAGAKNLVIVSGDRHWSEFSKVTIGNQPIYEFTSSSINQPHSRGTPTQNANRSLEKTFHQQNYGLMNIDWSVEGPVMDVQIRGENDQIELRTQLKF